MKTWRMRHLDYDHTTEESGLWAIRRSLGEYGKKTLRLYTVYVCCPEKKAWFCFEKGWDVQEAYRTCRNCGKEWTVIALGSNKGWWRVDKLQWKRR